MADRRAQYHTNGAAAYDVYAWNQGTAPQRRPEPQHLPEERPLPQKRQRAKARTALAPFTVVVCPVGADRSEAVKAAADELYAGLLAAGVDVILDDRGERPGAMFADWELIGVPHRVTIGDRGLKEGMVEYQHRRDAAATKVPAAEALAFVKGRLGA